MFCKSTFRAVCVSLLGAGSTILVHAQQAQTVAHVLQVSGEWRIDGKPDPAVAGAGLNPGVKIAAVSNHPGDALTIVRDDDMSRQRVACDATVANPCRNPIVIQGPSSGQPSGMSQLKGIVQAAIGVLLSKPPEISSHYAMTLSRGADAVRELEAVVELDAAKGVVLPTPPDDMAAGPYTFSITRARDSSPAKDTKLVLTSEGTWRPLSIDKPGLYEITINNAVDEKVADLMLLVAAPADFHDIKDRFETMKGRTAVWTGPAAGNDAHLFLRAFLLAESRV